jgi:hypothetical protein
MCKCHKVIFSSISESTCDNAIVRDTNNAAIELSLEVTVANPVVPVITGSAMTKATFVNLFYRSYQVLLTDVVIMPR